MRPQRPPTLRRFALPLLALACGPSGGGSSSSSGATDGSTTAATDAATTVADSETTAATAATTDTDTGAPLDPCYGDLSALSAPIPWDRGQPEIGGCLTRGVRDYRAIVHIHSPHSHDACDGDPQPGGELDEDCLADLRHGLCVTRVDVAFLTDHPAHADGVPLADMVLTRRGDQPVLDDQGRTVANWIACPEGHRVLLIPGIESGSMMPLGIPEHAPPGTYGESSPQSFKTIRDLGALAWVAHTEGRDVEELATLGLTGLEFYQLHANLDPDIRADHLGLDPAGFLTDVLPFFFPDGGVSPEPDLAPLGFLLPNEPSILAFERLGQTQRLTISAGTDAHQNVLPSAAPDGERIDSYRRMIRWFNNRLRIDGPLTVDSAKAALAAGRAHIVFESLGTPQGFDFYARGGDTTYDFGGELPYAPGLEIHAHLPHLDPRSPQGDQPPAVQGRLYRATAEGRELVAEWSEGALLHMAEGPGVYRLEVWITPTHLTPYLGDVAEPYRGRPIPWIYSGGLFVR
jgi:hypothetical protein